MNTEIRRILESVRDGSLSVDDAVLKIKQEPFTDLGYAMVDHHRKVRQGAAEVIYGAGKTAEQISGIAKALKEKGNDAILITRMSEEKAAIVGQDHALDYHKDAKIGIIGQMPPADGIGKIADAIFNVQVTTTSGVKSALATEIENISAALSSSSWDGIDTNAIAASISAAKSPAGPAPTTTGGGQLSPATAAFI